MILAITKELESFKAKVQETIDHVSSGVNNLNEEQQEKAVEMLHNLGETFYATKDRCFEALGLETLTARLAKAFANEEAKKSELDPPGETADSEPPADPSADPQSSTADPGAGAPVALSGEGVKEKLEEVVEKIEDAVGEAAGEAFESR